MANIDFIPGGVVAAKGFRAAGIHAGIRKNRDKKDLALVVSDFPAAAAATYTRNRVKGAPLAVTASHISDGYARAIICNSGIANTCAADGAEKAEAMCALAAKALRLKPEDVIVASTGVIGPSIELDPVEKAIPALAASLSPDSGSDAAEAIMTTDSVRKEAAVAFSVGNRRCILGGMAKGSGMIAPNMATMLCFLTTDAAIEPPLLREALREVVPDSFNMLSVDGDTSTNDMTVILANGASSAPTIRRKDADYVAFVEALRVICVAFCRKLAADGEGATRLITCRLSGAKTPEAARTAAKAVIRSSLVKAALFGADANWGRVLCALGYSDAVSDVNGIDVSFSSSRGRIAVCEKGVGLPFSEEDAARVLSDKEVVVEVALSDGDARATAWGCDLTYDYVKINGDYRT